MKRGAYIVLLLLAGAAVAAYADEKDQDKDAKKKKAEPPVVPVYVAGTDISTASMKVQLFDSLIQKGFAGRDSNGKAYDVKQFMFTYCERNLYEDSVGNPLILTDYLSEYAMDSKFNPYQLASLRSHAKPGDTLIIEKIKLEAADSTKAGAYGVPLKLYLVR